MFVSAKARCDTPTILICARDRLCPQHHSASVSANDAANFTQHPMRDLVCIQTAINRLTDAVEQIDLRIAIQRLGDDLSCFQRLVEKQCQADM